MNSVNLTPSEWNLMECLWEHAPRTGREAVEYFDRVYAFWLAQQDAHRGAFAEAKNLAEDCMPSPECPTAFLTVEGGSVLAGDLSRIAMLAQRGVRMLTLTWNGANELGGGQADADAHQHQQNTDQSSGAQVSKQNGKYPAATQAGKKGPLKVDGGPIENVCQTAGHNKRHQNINNSGDPETNLLQVGQSHIKRDADKD